jgi:teichuronic acid biosynthesis glycosyltransferase TuaG
MNKPFFSIVIPCFNRLTSLCSTLESCLQQSFNSYEIIMIDDHSTDDVKSVFIKYKDKFQASKNVEIRYFRLNENGGPSKARNFAWGKAKGEYIAFLDSDDLWHPEKLSISAFFIQKMEPQCLYDNYSYDINDVNKYADHHMFKVCWRNTLHGLFKNYSTTSSVIVKTVIAERFNESMRFNEDYDLWLRLSFKHPLLFINGSPLTVLGRPPSSPGGLSESIIKMRLGEMKMYTNICQQHIMLLPILPILIIFSVLKHIYARFKILTI